jgi:hypothetical protein
MPILPIGDRRLGAILLSSLELNETQFEQAISKSANSHEPLADSLIELGYITEQAILLPICANVQRLLQK